MNLADRRGIACLQSDLRQCLILVQIDVRERCRQASTWAPEGVVQLKKVNGLKGFQALCVFILLNKASSIITMVKESKLQDEANNHSPIAKGTANQASNGSNRHSPCPHPVEGPAEVDACWWAAAVHACLVA